MYWKYGIGVEQAGAGPRTGYGRVRRTRFTGAEGANYESVVRMHLSWIDESEVGRLLFRAIAREVLSTGQQNLAKFQEPVEAGAPTYGVLVQPYTGGDCNSAEESAVVSYSPYMFFGPCYDLIMSVTTNRGAYPQEVLFHELVHALRDASGYGNAAPLHGGLKGYGDMEEFIAVLVANIYMWDPTNLRADRLGSRKDHGLGKLSKGLSDSLDFFRSSTDTFSRIEQFCQENSWFTKHLAEVKATFNPIAAYYHDTNEARKRSQSATALWRDFFSE